MSRPKLTADTVREVLLGSGFVPSRPLRASEGTSRSNPPATAADQSPWLTPKEAAQRARCGVKTIYRETKLGRLRAARVGGRRDLRIRPEWVDAWLDKAAKPVEEAA